MPFLMYNMNTFDKKLTDAYLTATENGSIFNCPFPIPTVHLTAELC